MLLLEWLQRLLCPGQDHDLSLASEDMIKHDDETFFASLYSFACINYTEFMFLVLVLITHLIYRISVFCPSTKTFCLSLSGKELYFAAVSLESASYLTGRNAESEGAEG